jgi:glycosyltransferase involved in cell wall biosynthesis
MATGRKHRVLFDLGPALLKQAGIPQTTRQLFELFSRCPDVEVTGLIWSHSKECLLHRFYQGSQPHRRLSNEAEFLHAVLGHLDPEVETKWKRRKKEVRWHWRAWTQRFFPAQPLDPTWHDLIWRYYFASTLPPSARERLKQVNYVGATFTRTYFRERLKRALPLPVLDTRGFDTLFLQYPLPVRTTPGTRTIFRCQDLVPLLYFDTQPKSVQHIRFLQRSISSAGRDSLLVTAASQTEHEVKTIFSSLKLRTKTVPHFVPRASGAVPPVSVLDRILQARISPDTQSTSGWAPALMSGERLAREGYLIAVSTLEPRKNWLTLFQAFSLLRGQQSIRLVVVGSPGWKFEPILAALRPLVRAREVVHLSNVDRVELDALYAHARALIYPSFQEGFGLPPLEAAQQGTPSVVSDIPVHREVMDDSVLYCDPHDVMNMMQAMSKIAAETAEGDLLRQGLVQKAQERLGQYTEEKILQQWLETLGV